MASAADTRLHTPFGDFTLVRYPARQPEPLQAWCSADSLLLKEAHERSGTYSSSLVVNDEHGALCTALQPRALWTDSALSARAVQDNLQRNGLAPVPRVWSTAQPDFPPDCVVLRIPKQLAYFEHQLQQLAAIMRAESVLLAAGMDKHLSPHTAALLERYIGPTQRHRGQRKARLFSATLVEGSKDAPAVPPASYFCEALGNELVALPNVFSRDRLDPGSRLMLQQLDKLDTAERVADLACGNGVLGLVAGHRGLTRNLLFCDESAMAIASARINAGETLPLFAGRVAFHHGDGLRDYAGAPIDLILCNPPFHLNHAVDDFAGRRLLTDSARALGSGGRLCVVANRHLEYRSTLRRHFERVKKLAQDSKFIVWLAQKC